MALNPPVIFLEGDWDSNTTYLKNMTEDQQNQYGFTVQSSLNSLWIGEDDDNLNGSNKMIVVGSKSEFTSNFVIVIGYLAISNKSYSEDPDSPTYNPTFASKLVLNPSNYMNAFVIRLYKPASDRDPRFALGIWGPHGTHIHFTFNSIRIMSGGFCGSCEYWGVSVGNSVTFSTQNSGNPPEVIAATASNENLISGSVAARAVIDVTVPGNSVLKQAYTGLNLWTSSDAQTPGLPPFIIWDNTIYAKILAGSYLQMGGIIL